MEIAHWHETWTGSVSPEASRVYLGHETCVSRIPSGRNMMDILDRLRDAGKKITLVTPFLFESDLHRMCKAIEEVSNSWSPLEVVCNDWGLLHWLAECRMAEPIIGRLLAGQATDPRLASFSSAEMQLPYERLVAHADGIEVNLRYRRPTDSLMDHLRSCAICIQEVLSFLNQIGVRRFEVSNTLQGVLVTPEPGWNVTLHLPEVPITVARRRWRDDGTKWLHPTFPAALSQRDNMVFYCNENKPPNLDSLGIDRLVHRRND